MTGVKAVCPLKTDIKDGTGLDELVTEFEALDSVGLDDFVCRVVDCEVGSVVLGAVIDGFEAGDGSDGSEAYSRPVRIFSTSSSE